MAWFWWVIAAFVLGAGELFTLDLVFATLVVAALGGAGVALAGGPFAAQTIVAVVLAVGLLTLARPRILARLRAQQEMVPSGTAALAGRTALVLSAVDDLGGRVKLAGEEWSARSEAGATMDVGSRVRVVAIEGATAVVEPAPADAAQGSGPAQDGPTRTDPVPDAPARSEPPRSEPARPDPARTDGDET